MVELEKVFRKELFDKKLVEKIGKGVYKANISLSLADTLALAKLGYATIIVTDKFVTVAEAFFPPEFERIKNGEAKVEELYIVDMDKACEFMTKKAEEKNIKLSKTTIWWCNETIAIIEGDDDELL